VSPVVDLPSLRESCKQQVWALEAALTSELPRHEANTLIRESVAALLLLRWFDQAEAEQEAMAVFEDRSYRPLLPVELQWRQWRLVDHPATQWVRLKALVTRLEAVGGDTAPASASWLGRLAAPLRRLLVVEPTHWRDLLQWVAELPFETSSDRRALLELFDLVLAETSEAYDGQHQTPANIARLVAALAQPQQGERVYDPCFGGGNFLIAAWQQAERTWQQARRPGPLLEVAGIEINEATFLVGLTRMLLAGIDHPQLELGNSLERGQPNSPSREGFDLVLANPPIGAKVSREAWGHQHFAFPTADSVGLFVQHALAQLKPQGRAVIAVPEAFLFRGGAERELRRHLLSHGQVEAVVGLPAGSFAPYASVKGALLVLRRKGGANRVRMVDATPLFDARSDGKGQRKAPVIRSEMALQLAQEVLRAELRAPRPLPPGVPEGITGTGGLARSVWEVPYEELASADWDLTPRRREEGGLEDMLNTLQEALGEQVAISMLKDVARVTAGRAIRSADLLDEPPAPFDRGPAVPYLRIKDLQKGKGARATSWVRPELAAVEQRWALMPGDVLLSKSGTIGKAAIVRNGAVGAIAGNGLYVLRADPQRLDAAFLQAYLSSPSCQSWLTARARGAVIQHLNRGVLDELPVPLPPLHLQERAAAQFHDHGTDVLSFLLQLSPGGEAERLAAWLADFSEKLPVFAAGLDATPSLGAMEALVAMSASPRRWLEQDEVGSAAARWLRPLVDTLQPLAGAAQIPPGPGLLSVLQDAERAVLRVADQASGHQPVEAQARAVAERMRDWLRALIDDLTSSAELRVTQLPETLPAGSAAEFTVTVSNAGALPLRDLRLQSEPDWGLTSSSYLAERGELPFTLRGETPKVGDRLTLKVRWRARTLTGRELSGVLELAIRVAPPTVATAHQGVLEALGGNPYVTGSPLEPQHGHTVFYGREQLIEQISNQIATHGNVVLLEGNRRAGKTSILKHLEGRTAIPGWLAVYASLQAAEGAAQAVGVPTAEVFRLIAFELSKGIAGLAVDTPLPDGSTANREALTGASKLAKLQESGRIRKACRTGISDQSPFADFRDYLGILLEIADSQGLGIVLMLDEFDKLQEGIDNGVTSPQVPENIRFLIQSNPRFSAILTGSRRLKRLREEHWSALYGLGTSIPVTALDADSARRVVTEPVRGRLTFSDEAIEQIIALTARQPYLVQCLCNRIFDFASQAKTRSVTLAVVEDAATALVRDNEHFASLWDYAARGPRTGGCRRQLILLQCALAFKRGQHLGFGTLREQLAQVGAEAETADLDADLAYLRELDLVEFSGEIGDGQYGLAIPLMAQWIEQQQDADVVTSRARAEAEEEHA
jgi:type I restriction enzyme M protein